MTFQGKPLVHRKGTHEKDLKLFKFVHVTSLYYSKNPGQDFGFPKSCISLLISELNRAMRPQSLRTIAGYVQRHPKLSVTTQQTEFPMRFPQFLLKTERIPLFPSSFWILYNGDCSFLGQMHRDYTKTTAAAESFFQFNNKITGCYLFCKNSQFERLKIYTFTLSHNGEILKSCLFLSINSINYSLAHEQKGFAQKEKRWC